MPYAARRTEGTGTLARGVSQGEGSNPSDRGREPMALDEDFTGFAAARWTRLVRSAALIGCSPSDAEDLVQTTLTRCYVAWSKVCAADNPDAYVYRVLVNCHASSRRRHWWRERPVAAVPEVAAANDPIGEVDGVDAVERALGTLPEAQRQVLVLRFYAHLSERETAAALGIAPGTVKSRTSRALAALAASEQLADRAAERAATHQGPPCAEKERDS